MVFCETALTLGIAPADVLVGQLDRLLAVSTLPRVHLGIIPTRAAHKFLLLHGFWILDNHGPHRDDLGRNQADAATGHRGLR